MKNDQIWMIRAGRKATYVQSFLDEEYVAIGWDIDLPDLKSVEKEPVLELLKELSPSSSQGTLSVWASQIMRFVNEICVGDAVCTYDPNNRVYYLGTISSEIEIHDHELKWRRAVEWKYKVPRDHLSVESRNSLGAISAMFLVQGSAALDMQEHQLGMEQEVKPLSADLKVVTTIGSQAELFYEEASTKSAEIVEDLIASLEWDELQELVAEILKAMGYRTRVAGPGPDRGVDVFASPDGLGLEEPRIFVEVKHRPGTAMGSPEIRSFLGGRQVGDRCLYVSTGGFTKDARYEAERSTIPLTLIGLPYLRELLTQHYENLGPRGTTLVPLQKIYLPA